MSVLRLIRRTELGLTMVEMIAAVGVLSAVVLGTFTLTNQTVTDTQLSATAMHLKTVGEAAEKYMRTNRATVASNASDILLAKISVQNLIDAGHLPTAFTRRNPYGQEVCVLVWETIADNLRALVVAENVTGSQPIEDANLGQVVASIGGAGGAFYAVPPNGIPAGSVVGTMGGWNFPSGDFIKNNDKGTNCAEQAGQVTLTAGTPVMALWFSEISTTSPALYRDAVGNPALNTMNTPILMDSVHNVGDAPCTSGAIGRDLNGNTLTCAGGIWKRAGSWAWADPVDDYATLIALPPTATVGTVRVVMNPVPRAFAWTGAVWAPLVVDQNGDLTLTGTATSEQLIPTDSIIAGGACADNGAIAKDSGGAGAVICSNGRWKTAPDGVGDFGKNACVNIPHPGSCAAGFYVAGSHDSGGGFPGDDGIRCCRPQ